LRDSIRKKLRHEVQQIDQLLEPFGPLLNVTRIREPDLIELSALATVLHSFYGGIENIFTTIGKELDDRLPTGTKWHKDLLTQMSKPTDSRCAILNDQQHAVLIGYLSFRHFFRNSYAYQLDWDQLHPLVEAITETWIQLKTSLNRLLDDNEETDENPV
jgi:hypothetical protein